MHEVIAGYVARGWSLVRLRAGTPVPMDENWQRATVTGYESAYQAFGYDDSINVGVATGQASGVWVLDVDPRHNGQVSMSELLAQHGPLPDTYTVQTPGGGWHHYWLMPAGMDVRNSTSKVGPGIDVRGSGGQVAAPPSVRPDGAYVVLRDTPPVMAPDWLLGLATASRVAPAVTAPAGVYAPAALGLPPFERDRVGRYAAAAVGAELGRLAAAFEGIRNETAFRVACSVNELINAPWGQVDPVAAWQAFMVAGATSGLPEHELASCWDKGARKVAGQARAYPTLADVGFSPPGVFAPPGYAPAPAAGGAPVRMRDRAVRWSQLATMPEPEPLIEGYLFRDSLAWLSGEPGCGKSFIGIDFALCVATGLPWHGRPVKRGKVLYVMAEGSRGAWPRCAAWSRQHNGGAPVDDDAFAIYPDAVQAGDAVAWAELVEWVDEDAFDLIVLDTQARVTVGMEENSNTDMGVFVHRVEQLRAATGGTVLIVHHLPKGGDSLRGASALEGAAYTVLRAEKTGTVITVHQTKQKDSAELAPFLLRMEVVPLVAGDPAADGYGLPGVPAPALVDYDQAAAAERAAALSVDLSDGQARIVAVFVEVFYEGHGATKAEARVQFMRRGGSDAGFYRAWNWAIETARLARIQGRDSYRWVTNEG